MSQAPLVKELLAGLSASTVTVVVKKTFQPPLSGASFLARRDTTVCQSIACRSTLKPTRSSACLATGGSWLDDCRSVACIMTIGVPS